MKEEVGIKGNDRVKVSVLMGGAAVRLDKEQITVFL